MKLTARLSTWEADLSAYIASCRERPHEYGAHDCALFFAGGVIAMTGEDPAAPFRGQYSTAIGAAKALKKIGAGDLEKTLDNLFPVHPTGKLQRGDGVWNGNAVGICMGAYALFVGEEGERAGLIRVPRAEWKKGWRIV